MAILEDNLSKENDLKNEDTHMEKSILVLRKVGANPITRGFEIVGVSSLEKGG